MRTKTPAEAVTSNNPNFKAIQRLMLGAMSWKVRKYECKCSQDSKNKKNVPQFADSQAVEKQILRNHPDPVFNDFVCIVCEKKKSSTQQILDHIGQSVKVGGHAIRGQAVQNKYLRAIKNDTKDIFR